MRFAAAHSRPLCRSRCTTSTPPRAATLPIQLFIWRIFVPLVVSLTTLESAGNESAVTAPPEDAPAHIVVAFRALVSVRSRTAPLGPRRALTGRRSGALPFPAGGRPCPAARVYLPLWWAPLSMRALGRPERSPAAHACAARFPPQAQADDAPGPAPRARAGAGVRRCVCGGSRRC